MWNFPMAFCNIISMVIYFPSRLKIFHWKIKLTATHSHRKQYMTPNGGPKSGNHDDPSSFSCFPNWHSEKKMFEQLIQTEKRENLSLFMVSKKKSANETSRVNLSPLKKTHNREIIDGKVSLWVKGYCKKSALSISLVVFFC